VLWATKKVVAPDLDGSELKRWGAIAVVGRAVVMVAIWGCSVEELLSRIEYAHRNANYNS
jgi:hypothetical protein